MNKEMSIEKRNPKNVHINVYDFDKTIYNGDSTIDFYIFCIYKKPYLVFHIPICVFYFILYKMRIIDKLKFKEIFFSFLKYIKNVNNLVDLFWKKNKKKIKLWYINDSNKNKIIISASPEFLLKPIIYNNEVIDLIASKVNISTGKFLSKNCYGIEKVKRLNEIYTDYIIENFYSDSLSDIFLAQISKNSYLVKKDEIIKWNI